MKVKVCGMKYPENILQVAESSPDYMGFIFYEGSPRCAKEALDIDVLIRMGRDIDKVGVFVNERTIEIKRICDTYALSYVQLHGDESVEFCSVLHENGIRIMKAFQVNDKFDFESILAYTPYVDLFLFDTVAAERGGSGRKFDWSILTRYKGEIPFLLSGGISSGDLDAILNLRHPQLNGIDINSRFEISPGVKNVELVFEFIKNLRHAISGE